MNKCSLKYSLIENSHSFLIEAVHKAEQAKSDVHQWKFAILNLVQALELTLKEVLRREHPVLIYENIDFPKNTLSLSNTLKRLTNKKILGISLSEKENKKIKSAIQLRNEITHFEFEITEEYAMSKFSELFAFLAYIQNRYLKIEIDEVLGYRKFSITLNIEKCFKELKIRAEQRIIDEGISQENLWICPNCEEDTFVIEDCANVCFLCRHTEDVIECPQCGSLCFEFELSSFSDMIETEYEDGATNILNDYGYSNYNACPKCIDQVREKIENQREEEYYYYMEEQEWLDRSHRNT